MARIKELNRRVGRENNEIKISEINPTVQIGKFGLTDSTIAEIKKQLTKRQVIKIKFLKSFLDGTDRKTAALGIEQKTRANVISLVGNILTLRKNYKPPRQK